MVWQWCNDIIASSHHCQSVYRQLFAAMSSSYLELGRASPPPNMAWIMTAHPPPSQHMSIEANSPHLCYTMTVTETYGGDSHRTLLVVKGTFIPLCWGKDPLPKWMLSDVNQPFCWCRSKGEGRRNSDNAPSLPLLPPFWHSLILTSFLFLPAYHHCQLVAPLLACMQLSAMCTGSLVTCAIAVALPLVGRTFQQWICQDCAKYVTLYRVQ